MHPNSLLLFRAHVAPLIGAGARVLEIAPDGHPSSWQQEVKAFGSWETADLVAEMTDAGRRWGGGRQTDVAYPMTSEERIPAPDDSFDFVLSASVIEHVRRPWQWMTELARVCLPGGMVVTVGPVSWPYHEAPIDCWRIYPEGMRVVCEDAGLTVVKSLWESLEPKPRRWYPGLSYNQDLGPKGRLLNGFLAKVGWPLPVAFDTITIAQKC